MLFATLGALGLQDYTKAAAVTFIFSISEWLESLAAKQARNALSAIVKLRPERTILIGVESGNIIIVPAAALSVGSFVVVRTGESRPVQKGPAPLTLAKHLFG